MNNIEISVIVCTYNREETIEEALLSLINQNFPAEQYEILIIDNNSTDQTSEIITRLSSRNNQKSFKYILEKAQGLSYARNRGLREAQGEYVAFIDDDGIADPNWLAKISEAFKLYSADAVGGRVDLAFRCPIPFWFTKKFHGWLSAFQPIQSEPYQVVTTPFPVGCNMVFRRSMLLELNGFDPDLGRKGRQLLGGEETKIFLSMIERNWQIWAAPAALVKHIVSKDRLKMSYFIKVQKGQIVERIPYYQSMPIQKRLLLAVFSMVEIIGNGIGFLLGVLSIRYWFLAFLYLYRSWVKFTTIVDPK